MKAIFYTALLSSLVAFGAHAAPLLLTGEAAFDRTISHDPLNLLPRYVPGTRGPTPSLTMESTLARVNCDATESQKICDVRKAAARRAWEVTEAENANISATPATILSAPLLSVPLSLLVPAGLIPVRAIACDPSLTTEECARLEKKIPSNPPGPLPPNAPAPPPTPVPPAVPAPEEPGVTKAPGPAVDPVPANPPSVIPPPPTGDHDLVQPPPKSGSKMPVIKPKAAPPVNPQPQQ